nr:hypothetical protein [Tanacetum cinerariifolium]
MLLLAMASVLVLEIRKHATLSEEYRCEDAKRHMVSVTHRLRSELEKQKYSNNTLTTHSGAIHVTRLELSVFDRTASVVVVKFDEIAMELVKVSADSILKVEDEINPTELVEESACSSTDDAIADKHVPSLKRLSRHQSVATPSKPHDAKKTKRINLEDLDTEAAFGSSKEADEDKTGSSSDWKKEYVNKMDLSDIEVPRVFVTCRNMDDWTENCILLHFMLGQQLELTGILQLVLLGVNDRRLVPNWIL